MAFVRSLAKVGMFGLAGLAASGAGSKHKKTPKPSLVSSAPMATNEYGSTPTLISKQGI